MIRLRSLLGHLFGRPAPERPAATTPPPVPEGPRPAPPVILEPAAPVPSPPLFRMREPQVPTEPVTPREPALPRGPDPVAHDLDL
jgi:hypothetical protein